MLGRQSDSWFRAQRTVFHLRCVDARRPPCSLWPQGFLAAKVRIGVHGVNLELLRHGHKQDHATHDDVDHGVARDDAQLRVRQGVLRREGLHAGGPDRRTQCVCGEHGQAHHLELLHGRQQPLVGERPNVGRAGEQGRHVGGRGNAGVGHRLHDVDDAARLAAQPLVGLA
eukprot:9431618-Alexandrium_andersonii.AAC.1